VACRGGGAGERGGGPGHPKSEITKIKILQLDDFPIVWLLTHGAQMSFLET